MTNQQILETLSNCIEIAKTTDNNYTVNKLTEVAEALMQDRVKQAKQTLKNVGYYVDNLWSIEDVQAHHECTNEQSYRILDNVLSSRYIIGEINEQINNHEI